MEDNIPTEKITLTGYHSKKQPCIIYLGFCALCIVAGIIILLLAEGDNKYGCIVYFLFVILCVFGLKNELKQPEILLQVIDDKYIIFYTDKGKKVVDLYAVSTIHYWRAAFGLRIVFYKEFGSISFSGFLQDSREIKEYLLNLFEKHHIEVVSRYSKH